KVRWTFGSAQTPGDLWSEGQPQHERTTRPKIPDAWGDDRFILTNTARGAHRPMPSTNRSQPQRAPRAEPALASRAAPLPHHRDPLRRPGYPRIEPTLRLLAKHETLVEQIDIVPLAALRLVHGEAIPIGEFVILPAQLPAHFRVFAGEKALMRPHLSLHRRAIGLLGIDCHLQRAARPLPDVVQRPDLPVEQPFLRIVPQAHQPVTLDGDIGRQPPKLPNAVVV